MRSNGRKPGELREIMITRSFIKHAEGSVLVEFGDTRVICNASVEESVPPFLRGKGTGWVTAEYAMLPRATHTRSPREAAKALRAVIDLTLLGERSIHIDCDVIQADGGTRTASITGAYIALVEAVNWLMAKGSIAANPLREAVAAVSVGIVAGEVLLDLDYAEDSTAEVDMNFVVTSSGRFVEVQGTAETEPFTLEQMDAMRTVALEGINQLLKIQQEVLT